MTSSICLEIKPEEEYCWMKPNIKIVPCSEPTCTEQGFKGFDRCWEHWDYKCQQKDCDEDAPFSLNYCMKHTNMKYRCKKEGCNERVKKANMVCEYHGGCICCNKPSCTTPAKRNGRCWKHGLCVEPTCTTPARTGYDRCTKHGGGKRCIEPNCTSSAVGRYDRCTKHGGGKKCPHCIDWIDSRSANNNYDGYCATCFKQLFPNDPRSKIASNRKELLVRKRINEEFDGFIHDRTMYTGHCDCTHRRRIDHRKMICNTMIAVETDEFGHTGYDKIDEMIRYDDLFMIFSGKWIYIRFNPDDNRSKVPFEDKLDTLIDTIRNCIERIENEQNNDLVEIIKLFY